ncbi:uncharacterized protein LOC132204078 isoform X2 [Neocloeon triangulifer]|uniref:uncharacterized protein LOC132204078 isoform X2 n=1 Tax=Neocloeon triangulifer TaxID=2078957 RepID=UPI00286F60CE|nr:uncharacterized protein LOC132204078 isoform X2 [Neocloeon triangulifer]
MEHKDYKDMSPAERRNFVKVVESRRRNYGSQATSKIERLKTLSMKTIVQNYMHFIAQKPSSLRHLPNSLIQEFLELMGGKNKKLLPMFPIFQRLLLKKLLNSNTTEFDGCKFSPDGTNLFTWEDIFGHLLKKCPKMSKFVQIYDFYWGVDAAFPMDDFLRWTKLEHASINRYVCTDEHLDLIQQHLPQLKYLHIGMAENTEKAAVAFSKMQNLKHLSITPGLRNAEIDYQLLTHCAGRTPNLQKFSLYDEPFECAPFDLVSMFWKMYWYKKITITDVIVLPIDGNWPPNVSVECLVIYFDQSSKEEHFKRLSTVPCSPAQLSIAADPSDIYKLVNMLGQKTKTISIRSDDIEQKLPLDLLVVLEHCPNLEHLDYGPDGFCSPEIIRNSPEKFRNLKSFESIYIVNKDLEEDSKANGFYKQFLLGSECHDCKYLQVVSHSHVLAILEAAAERPNCLKLVEKVSVLLYKDPMLESVLKMVQRLIFCSPNLVKVFLCLKNKTTTSTLSAIEKDHSWFKQLVTKVGVACFFVPNSHHLLESSFYERHYSSEFMEKSDVSSSDEESDDDVVV